MTVGTEIAQAYVKIRPDTQGFAGDVRTQVEGPLQSVRRTALGIGAGLAAIQFFKHGLQELEEAEAVAAQTTATIKATGAAANVTSDEVADLAKSLGEMSGRDAEAIQAGQNLLLTFKAVQNQAGEGNDIFDQATATALDLSVAFKQDMTQSAVLLGKALEDPIGGLTALRRVGVTFSESQKAVITSLVQSGNLMEAQKVILRELESQVGGSAKAFGETLPGKIKRGQNAFQDMAGSVVAIVAPALEKGAGAAKVLAEGVEGLPDPVKTAAVGMIALALAAKPVKSVFDGVASAGQAVSDALQKNREKSAGAGTGFAGAAVKAAALTAALAGVLAYVDHLNTSSTATQSKLFADVDFTDFDKSAAKLTETGALVNALGAKWDEYTDAEKLWHAEDYKLWNDAAGQQEEHLRHLEANRATLARVGAELGIGADRAKQLAAALQVDPATIPYDKLADALREAAQPGADLDEIAKSLGRTFADTAPDVDEAAVRYKNLRDTYFATVDAAEALRSATDRVTDSKDAEIAATRQVADALRSEAAAAEHVGDAIKQHADDLRATATAVDAVRKAEADLAAARQGPSIDDQLRQRGAVLSIRQAEEALAKAKKEHLPAKERELRVAQAQLALDEAVQAQKQLDADIAAKVGKAEAELASARDRVTAAQDTAANSAKAITDARYAQEAAARGVASAEHDVEKAHRDTERAQVDLFTATEGLTQKQADLAAAVKDDNDQFATLTAHLVELKTMYPELTGVVNDYLNELAKITPPGRVDRELRPDNPDGTPADGVGPPNPSAPGYTGPIGYHGDNPDGTPSGQGIGPPQHPRSVQIVHNYNGVSIEEAQRQAAARDRRHLSMLSG